MYYRINEKALKTEDYFDVFEIPAKVQGALTEEDDWVDNLIEAFTTDSPKPITVLLYPSAPLARLQSSTFISDNRLIFSTKKSPPVTPLQLLGIKTEQIRILTKAGLFRTETAFKNYFKLKPQTNLVLRGVSSNGRSIKIGEIQYPFDKIAIRPLSSDESISAAIRWTDSQTLLLLPLPQSKLSKIIKAVTKIAAFYRSQTLKYWDGTRELKDEFSDPSSECQKHILRIPEHEIPTLNDKELYFWSRSKPRYRKNLGEKHIRLLRLLRAADNHSLAPDGLADFESKQLTEIVFDLRSSFEIAIGKPNARGCLFRSKGKSALIILKFQIE